MGIRGNRKGRPRYRAALLVCMDRMDASIDAGLLISGNYAETVYVCTSGSKAVDLLQRLTGSPSNDLPEIVFLDVRLLKKMRESLFVSLEPFHRRCGFRYVVVGSAPGQVREPGPSYSVVERPLTEAALMKL